MDDKQRAALAAVERMPGHIAAQRFVLFSAAEDETGMECWSWLLNFIRLVYDLIRENRLTDPAIVFTYESRERR